MPECLKTGLNKMAHVFNISSACLYTNKYTARTPYFKLSGKLVGRVKVLFKACRGKSVLYHVGGLLIFYLSLSTVGIKALAAGVVAPVRA